MPVGSSRPERASLPPVDVSPRAAALVDAVEATGVDHLIVSAASNIRWLTGFAGSNAMVVVSADGAVTLITDPRYRERAPVELASVRSNAAVEVVEWSKVGELVARLVEDGGEPTVGLEAHHVSWSQQRAIDEHWLPQSQITATTDVVETLRSVKDDAEVARIECAAAIVDEALETILPLLTDGATERAVARTLEARIRERADDLGFDAIVASGPNGAVPHHAPVDRRIAAGDLVIIDTGARIDGYRSDMTRTFCIGPMSVDQARHYDVVAAAQQAAVEAMVVGATTGAVDAAARRTITEAGWGESFTHGTGHGVGLDIHELPRVARDVETTYQLGTVATVEPGIYLSGVGGVRVEDTCVVEADGARRLTTFPKDPELSLR